jgi:hypothetical protein
MPTVNEAGSRASLVLFASILGALGAAIALPEAAEGQEHSFAGSAQTSYSYVPTSPNPRSLGFDGFIPELSMKMTADINDHVSAQVKVCYGCHGVELAMAFTDLRLVDEFNVRVGRFNPAFGEFPLRADPANHSTIDRPLPYDMGRMLRLREFNMGVVPAPYVDTGIEISGTHWFGDSVQVDYAVYAVGGFRGNGDGADLDFIQSRSSAFYYVDNNSQPAGGARLALTIAPTSRSVITFGGSGMYGRYDPDARLDYLVLGADIYARLDWFMIRAEYLMRRTEMDLGDDPASRFAYGPGADGVYADFFRKDGYYVEVEADVNGRARLVARFDGLRRTGNVLLGSSLRSESSVHRYTLGFNLLPHPAYRIKIFGEYYDFSDFSDEIVVQAAIAASF